MRRHVLVVGDSSILSPLGILDVLLAMKTIDRRSRSRMVRAILMVNHTGGPYAQTGLIRNNT